MTHSRSIAANALDAVWLDHHTSTITALRQARDKQGAIMATAVKKPAAKKKIVAPKAKKCVGGKKGK